MSNMEADHWRAMAAMTRSQAKASTTDGAREALDKMADDYEAEAGRLDKPVPEKGDCRRD